MSFNEDAHTVRGNGSSPERHVCGFLALATGQPCRLRDRMSAWGCDRQAPTKPAEKRRSLLKMISKLTMTTLTTTTPMPQLPRLPLTKAVFPVAGLGTRFLPAAKAIPKEMLPVVDKPLIQYAVEEAYAAGILQMIFVTGRNKRAIEDHFDTAYELEAANKHEIISLVRSIKPHDMSCVYVRQSKALGLGHAVLCAEPLVGNEAFAVLLADDLMIGQTPILQ